MTEEWKNVRDWVLREYASLVVALWEAGLRNKPVSGYELTDDNGHPTDGLAELAWPDQKVAAIELEPDNERLQSGRDAFHDQSWTTVDIAAATDNPDLLLDLLEDDR
jgi:hypothetical protein